MTYQQQKESIEANLKARKLRLKLVMDEYDRQQRIAQELIFKNRQDEVRIKELNELIEVEKPTYANHVRLTRAIGLLLFIIPSFLFAQDTIHTNKVRVCNVVYTKSGKVYKKFFKNVKVKTGYIVNKGNGVYEINGKMMRTDIDTLIAKK